MKGLVIDIETIGDIQSKDYKDVKLTVCGWYDYTDNQMGVYTEEELPKLWERVQSNGLIIGYNSVSFDIPILNKYTTIELDKIKQLDILKEIKKSLGRRIPLEWVANGTLGTGKLAKGVDAMKWWENGEFEKVKEYCLEDVKITKNIFDYLIQNKCLKYKDYGITYNIKIDIPSSSYAPAPQNLNLF